MIVFIFLLCCLCNASFQHLRAILQQNACPAGQEYQQCGTACPPTCANPNPGAMMCPTHCVSGCFCQEGFLLTSDGDCVVQSECPGLMCNEDCVMGTQCNPHTGHCEAVSCDAPDACHANKACQPLFSLCPLGVTFCPRFTCVDPPTCPPGQEYQQCGTLCPPTCDNPIPGMCPDQCVSGCFCQEGFLLTSDGHCVVRSECPGLMCNEDCVMGTQCNPHTGHCEAVSCDAPNACPANKACQPRLSLCPLGVTFCPRFTCV